MVFGFAIFWLVVIALELVTGFAMIGSTGDTMVVGRDKSPGIYWFAIILHLLFGVGLPALILFDA